MLLAVVSAVLVAIGLPLLFTKLFGSGPDLSKFPAINPPLKGFSLRRNTQHTDNWLQNAQELIHEGIKKFKAPFLIYTQQGPRILLSPEYIDAIKSDPRLSMDRSTAKDMFSDYYGFEALKESGRSRILHDTVRIKLTQNLTKVTKDLATEVSGVLEHTWGKSEEWHAVNLTQDVFALVSRLSTRVFLGKELANNQEWLEMAVQYTLYLFYAVRALRAYPPMLRPIANLYLKECRQLRASKIRAQQLIEPIVQARRIARTKPGYEPPNDTLEWMEEIAKGAPYDATMLQLGLTMAAIHTTSDLQKTTMLDLAQHPDVVDEIREEIATVLSSSGWEKTNLYKMQLMDSAIKESQRMKPAASVSLGRMVMEDMALPDGTVLPKGAQIMASAERMWDSSVHANPEVYDAKRFLKIRQTPGSENAAQLVTTGPDHMAFGHGKHACPGRFFAANEVKIAMAYILMNYDIRLAGERKPQPYKLGFEWIVDPTANLEVRRRKPEINLDSLE